MPKKRSHPMPPPHKSSQDYGGSEAGLSRCYFLLLRLHHRETQNLRRLSSYRFGEFRTQRYQFASGRQS